MPQLNPTPWFTMLALSWLVLTTTFLVKTQNISPQNPPTPPHMAQKNTPTWTWPWL